jgi:hypothetical protein
MAKNVLRWEEKQMFMMKSEVVDHLQCVDLVQTVDQKFYERRQFTITEISCEFPQISCTALYKDITVRPGYHKLCRSWVPKMLIGVHKMQRMASALTLL